MSSSDDKTTLALSDRNTAETRMRQALGLGPASSGGGASRRTDHQTGHHPGRTRFVKDGEVPLVMVGGRRDSESPDGLRERIATLENLLETEKAERATAQRALADAQMALQYFQTKLAHAEMASAEALAAERKALSLAEAKLAELTSAAASARAEPAATRTPAPRGRRPKVRIEAPEPEPVAWWLPDYGSKKHG